MFLSKQIFVISFSIYFAKAMSDFFSIVSTSWNDKSGDIVVFTKVYFSLLLLFLLLPLSLSLLVILLLFWWQWRWNYYVCLEIVLRDYKGFVMKLRQTMNFWSLIINGQNFVSGEQNSSDGRIQERCVLCCTDHQTQLVVFDDQYNKVHTFPVLVTQRGWHTSRWWKNICSLQLRQTRKYFSI
jgi:hypothetical protein